jgi:NTP pyrophosphatase (non-canonical NTP hydrolase)
MDMNMIEQITAEVARATVKFPTWPTDPLHALAVLGEEYGELTKAMLQLTYEPHKTTTEEVRSEAIQTAAMALRLAMSLERYRYAPCHQHSQCEPPTPRHSSEGDRYIGMHVDDISA